MATIVDFVHQAQEANRIIQRQLQPIAEMSKQLQVRMIPVVESRQRLIDSIIDARQRFSEVSQISTQFITGINQLNNVAQAYQKSLEQAISPAFSDLRNTLLVLPERTRDALLVLGEHDWFLDLSMPLPSLWKLQRIFESGDVEEAEAALVCYFQDELSNISQSIEDKFPRRIKILQAAFAAHARQEYELSVPVFLAQADGICQELIDIGLFQKDQKRPATAVFVERIERETFRSALLYPLTHCLPISASASDRTSGFSGLNRHQVLHGESVTYGTEVNSLKTISLINYITHALSIHVGNDEDE